MATRFYLPGIGTAPISPSFDANWEQTGSASRWPLIAKGNRDAAATANSNSITIPITTTQDVLAAQFVSAGLRKQYIEGTVSLVIRVSQNNASTNATLAACVRVVSGDGATVRGTLFSVYGTDTAYPLTASPATRIINAQTITPLTIETGDRLVVEVGCRATAPSVSDTAIHRSIYDSTTADYALTTALTTSLNPWVEFSQNLTFLSPTVSVSLRPRPFAPGIAR